MDTFKTFASRLHEAYANELGYLLDYLRKEPLSLDEYRSDFEEWICGDDDRRETAAKILGINVDEINADDSWAEWSEDLLQKDLPAGWEQEYTKWWKDEKLDYHMQHNPAETPTWAHLSLEGHKSLLPRSTWLVHFTDNSDDICSKGFKYGMMDMEKLGLTTSFIKNGFHKRSGGYNFAFEADSRYARQAANAKKYGDHAVMFQSAGVEVYHYADEEHQIIFWGPSVDPRDIILIDRLGHYEGWAVRPSIHSHHSGQESKDGAIFKGKEFSDCANWVERNARQYRSVITGR